MNGRVLPTRREDWTRLGSTTASVLRTPQGAGVAVVVAALALTAFSLGQQLDFVATVVELPWLTLRDRLAVLLDQYPVVGSAYGPVRGWLLVVVSGQTGVVAALGVRALRERGGVRTSGDGVLGTVGVVFGAAGAGCAACGPTVFAAVLGAMGLTGVMAALPFDGVEFLVLGAVAMLCSLHRVSLALDGAACRVDAD